MSKLNYRLYVDVGNWYSPISGSGFIVSSANIEGSGLTKSKDSNIIAPRISHSGNIIFKGVEYDALKTLSLTNLKVGVKFYEGTTEIFEGYISLFDGEFDEDSKLLNASIPEFVDPYTDILKNIDTETNILNHTAYSLILTSYSDEDRIYSKNSSLPPFFYFYLLCPSLNPPVWTVGTYYNYHMLNGSDPVIHNGIKYWCKISHTATLLNQPPNATYWETGIVNVFVRQKSNYPMANYVYDPNIGLYARAKCTQDIEVHTLDRFRKMFDVLKALVQQSDPTINIDETGTNEYSPYLNSFSEIKNLFIAAKYDIKRFDSSSKATILNISLKEILEIYKLMFNLDWYIENGYFKLIHPTESNPTIVGVDATNYKNRNWSKGKSSFKYLKTDEINKEIWDFESSGQEDFDGLPILYDIPYVDEKKYDLSKINTNLVKLMTDSDDIEDNGFVIASAEYSTTYNIQESTGLISGNDIWNGNLSLAQLLIDHHLVDRPFNYGTVNGVGRSLAPKKNKEQSILLPISNPDDVDFSKLIRTDLADLEIFELSIKFDGSLAEIKGRY